ncbi:hypothetical protein FB451DRAFT_1521821 [Mycena latifolia]|nr:hypothetical protein FB451DRAFT_1521821 [Mycena latifolia]
MTPLRSCTSRSQRPSCTGAPRLTARIFIVPAEHLASTYAPSTSRVRGARPVVPTLRADDVPAPMSSSALAGSSGRLSARRSALLEPARTSGSRDIPLRLRRARGLHSCGGPLHTAPLRRERFPHGPRANESGALRLSLTSLRLEAARHLAAASAQFVLVSAKPRARCVYTTHYWGTRLSAAASTERGTRGTDHRDAPAGTTRPERRQGYRRGSSWAVVSSVLRRGRPREASLHAGAGNCMYRRTSRACALTLQHEQKGAVPSWAFRRGAEARGLAIMDPPRSR